MAEPLQLSKGKRIALRCAITVAALGIWFWTQSLIGARPIPHGDIYDAIHHWTTAENSYLHQHPQFTNALLIGSSALIDVMAIYLLAMWLFGPTIRPFLGLLLLLGLRQLVQVLVGLPAPPDMIWHYPGFPSLLVTYGVAGDFFFSGHTAIAVFTASELARRKRFWLTAIATALVIFEITVVLVLRAHYTMDVLTGILAALFVAQIAGPISRRIDFYTGRY